MLRAIQFIAVAITAAGLSLACVLRASDLPRVSPDDAYIVYSAVLQAMFFDSTLDQTFGQVRRDGIKQIVIVDQTSMGYPPILGTYHRGSERVSKELAPLPDGFLDQLFKENESPRSLENRFSIQAKVTLLSHSELERLEDEFALHGWDKFHRENEGAQGILLLSRVTYDPSRTIALVYAASASDNQHGAGYVALLSRSNDIWRLERVSMLWIS
jgi:hypothetical protein